MRTFGRRQVMVGAAMSSLAAVLPAAPGTVLRWHMLNTLRPLAKGETFDFVYEAVDGFRYSFASVVIDRRLDGEEWEYDVRTGPLVRVGDVPLGVRPRRAA